MRSSNMLLLAIVLTAAAFASVRAAQEWLWMDECFTVLESIGQVPFSVDEPLDRTFESCEFWAAADMAGVHRALIAGDNGNMSAYVAMIHALVRAFGPDRPAVLFAPGILAYCAGIVWCARLGRSLFSERVGLLAAVLFACHKEMQHFCVELRSYSLAVAACLIATECFVRIVGLDRPGPVPAGQRNVGFWAILYSLTALAALFLHYLSGLVLLGHVLFAVAAVRDRRSWSILIAAGSVVTLIFLPVRGVLLPGEGYAVADAYNGYARRVNQVPTLPPAPWGLYDLWRNSYHVLGGLPPLTDRFFTAAVPLAAIAVGLRRTDFGNRPGAAARMGFMAVMASVLPVAAVAGYFANLSILPNAPRYQIFSMPFIQILIAVGLASLVRKPEDEAAAKGERSSSRVGRITFVIYLIFVVASPVLVTLIAVFVPNRNDYREWAHRIAAGADQGVIRRVEVPSLLDCQMIAFYLGPERCVPLAATDSERTRRILRKLDEMKLQHPLSVFMETKFEYADEGADIARFEVESDSEGVLRLRYALRKGDSATGGSTSP